MPTSPVPFANNKQYGSKLSMYRAKEINIRHMNIAQWERSTHYNIDLRHSYHKPDTGVLFLKGQCVGIVYNGSHAIVHDFTACEIINVT